MDQINISTDKNLLNIPIIHDFLCNRSYWAQGRSLKTVQKSIENSICFGVYDTHQNQLAFARVLTDHSVFAYIMDVTVFEGYRGQGIGKLLMKFIMEHDCMQGLQRIMLATKDAHLLYEKSGFKHISKPELWMEIVNKPS